MSFGVVIRRYLHDEKRRAVAATHDRCRRVDGIRPMIYIVVRKTTEWGKEAVVHAQLPEGLRYSVGLWNSTFALPYHLFRQELARIAGINRSRIAGALCVPRAEVPAGATVVPTDDDDWFSPGLATTLETAIDDS